VESNPFLSPATPALPVAPYIGGKHNLAPRIIDRIAAIPHSIYVESFVGMGGIFLRRPFRASSEVINDISSDVATLFRILQRHYVPFLETMRWQLTSRAEFERLARTDPDTLTDLERAARFLYLQRTAFGGKVAGRSFGASIGASARFDITRLAPLLEAAHERLASVVIERLPYDELLQRYDRPETLFYLDPPYWGSELDYGRGAFGRVDFGRLARLLGEIRGRFLLSINDTPEIRKIFAAFPLEEVRTTYSISGEGNRPAAELLISNAPPPATLFTAADAVA
jgi:DNA adenine methylase